MPLRKSNETLSKGSSLRRYMDVIALAGVTLANQRKLDMGTPDMTWEPHEILFLVFLCRHWSGFSLVMKWLGTGCLLGLATIDPSLMGTSLVDFAWLWTGFAMNVPCINITKAGRMGPSVKWVQSPKGHFFPLPWLLEKVNNSKWLLSRNDAWRTGFANVCFECPLYQHHKKTSGANHIVLSPKQGDGDFTPPKRDI